MEKSNGQLEKGESELSEGDQDNGERIFTYYFYIVVEENIDEESNIRKLVPIQEALKDIENGNGNVFLNPKINRCKKSKLLCWKKSMFICAKQKVDIAS